MGNTESNGCSSNSFETRNDREKTEKGVSNEEFLNKDHNQAVLRKERESPVSLYRKSMADRDVTDTDNDSLATDEDSGFGEMNLFKYY